MLTLAQLNALPEISWHSGEAGGLTRTLSDFAYWTGGIEFSITWDFDALPDDDTEYNHQTQHVRISHDSESGKWILRTLDEPHGLSESSLLGDQTQTVIDAAVIQRIRTHSDAFAQGVPTRRFAVAFYRGEI